MNNNMQIAKTLTFIGAIIGIVSGALWCFTLVGIIWGVPSIIGGVTLLKYRDYSDEEYRINSNNVLIWGIVFIFTSWLVGGVLLIVSYFFANGYLGGKQDSHVDDLLELEKAFELLQKGVITEEEYEEIKRRVMDRKE